MEQSPYSRKCPERPYESLMSIIAKFPWHRGEYYTVLQRDHLFEALKSNEPSSPYSPPPTNELLHVIVAIETLRISMRKRPLPNLNNVLLDRLVRTGLLNICFTDRQKQSLLHAAGHPVPPIQSPLSDLPLCAVGPTDPSVSTTPVSPFPFPRMFFILFSYVTAFLVLPVGADDQTTDPRSPPSFAPPSMQLWTHDDNEDPRRSRNQGYSCGVGYGAGWGDEQHDPGRCSNSRVQWERIIRREECLASPLQRKGRGIDGLIVRCEDGEEEEFVVERRGTLLDRLRQRV